MTTVVRYLSYSIDTVLLTAALMLASMLHRLPFVDMWLTTKIALVVVYIAVGSYALSRGRSPRARRVFYLLALLAFAAIYTVARSRSAPFWAGP